MEFSRSLFCRENQCLVYFQERKSKAYNTLMTTENKQPRFLSSEFHLKFFPALVLNRFKSKQQRSPFVPYGFMETIIGLVVCFILIAIGVPSALKSNSVLGWILTGIGVIGFLFVLGFNISARLKISPSYDDFLIGIFFFFTALGLTSGVMVGTLNHSLILGILASAAGLAAGYLIGIFAGLFMQYFGHIAVILNGIAALAIIGLVLVDIVLLSGAIF